MWGAGDGSGHGEQTIGNPSVPTQTPAERGWTQGKAGDAPWRDGSGSEGVQEAYDVLRDFPSGPVVKTLHFQCRGHGFDPW